MSLDDVTVEYPAISLPSPAPLPVPLPVPFRFHFGSISVPFRSHSGPIPVPFRFRVVGHSAWDRKTTEARRAPAPHAGQLRRSDARRRDLIGFNLKELNWRQIEFNGSETRSQIIDPFGNRSSPPLYFPHYLIWFNSIDLLIFFLSSLILIVLFVSLPIDRFFFCFNLTV